MDKVLVEKLPETGEGLEAKRWKEERGEFVQIVYNEEMRHLAVFEIRKGFTRGGHHHERKEEIFYVVHGKIEARFIDMDTLQKGESILAKGDKIRIKPRCGHLFEALEDALVVEYSPQVYEVEDSHRIDF
ncbi:MAG: cupin domain-containing protein [Thermodesulfobacteriota bacterium]